MSYNSAAVANQLATVLAGLAGMGGSQVGAPESIGKQVTSYVTFGSFSPTRKTNGVVQREQRFFCMFAYRVDGNETAAETALMGLVDAFLVALQADFTLNNTVKSLEASSQAADEPDYQLRAAKEYREYPVVVTVTQQANYAVNP